MSKRRNKGREERANQTIKGGMSPGIKKKKIKKKGRNNQVRKR